MARRRAPYGDRVVLDYDTLKLWVEDFLATDVFVFDVETRNPGGDPFDTQNNEVFWISFASRAGAFTVPLGHPRGEMIAQGYKEKEPWYDHDNPTKTGKPRKKWRTVTHPPVFADPPHQIRPDRAWDALEPLLFSDLLKIGWNVPFDAKSVAKYYGGQAPPGPFWDGQVAEHILDENLPSKGLKETTARRFKFRYAELAKGGELDSQPFGSVARYSLYDAVYEWLCFCQQEREISDAGFDNIMDLDMDLTEALIHAEYAGARIDTDLLDELAGDLGHRMKEVKALIWRETGSEINLDSNDQVAWFVYEHRKHTIPAWTSGGKQGKPKPKTDEKALKPISKKDQHVARILEYSELSKMHGTYVEGIRKRLVGDHVHPNHRVATAVTGRLSCAEPNLQNIPAPKNDIGKKIRGMFIAPEGCRLFVADYAQIEPRTLAHFSGDPEMMRIFRAGEDIYTGMGSRVYRKAQDEIEKSERDAMKILVLSLMYGVGIGNIADQLGVKPERAEELRGDFYKAFPTAYRWMKETVRKARFAKPPHTQTLLGRKRRLPELLWSDDGYRKRAERQAVNHVIQGSAGEIMKVAFVRLHRMLPEGISVRLTVHDEVVGVVPSERTDEAVSLVSEAMTGSGIQQMLAVPIEAEVKIVDTWADAK